MCADQLKCFSVSEAVDDFLQPFIQEAITIAQFENTLEERNKEIKSLKEEVVKLKEELHNVKTRNKKLCNILALGESKHFVVAYVC